MNKIVEMKCPSCGDLLSIDMKQCPSCYRPITITTFNSVNSMTPLEINKYANAYREALAKVPDNKPLNLSLAMCFLKLKLYDKALPYFEKAIVDNFDNSEAYFYAAICLLRGKKAFLTGRKEIDQIEEYLNAAIMIEPKGIYHYFVAYIKYDYFFRKYFNTSPTYQQALAEAKSIGLSPADVSQFYQILGVTRPDVL